MRKALIAMLVLTFVNGLFCLKYSQSKTEAYMQGRTDKNAEMMRAITDDPLARIAIMTKTKLTYHEAGICVTCHRG